MAKKINSNFTESKGLDYYYDEEIFNNRWLSEVDPVSLVLIESGVVVYDATIESMIAGGGNYYTIPFYKDLEGEPQVYDGNTDLEANDTSDGAQSGVVYGQMIEFMENQFVRDFTSAKPMDNIIARISKFWSKIDQKAVVCLLEGIFGITDDEEWAKHTYNIASSGSEVTEDNTMGLTTLRDASVKALGENADKLVLAIMHSKVANDLSNLQVLNFFTYESNGMSYDVNVARSGNLLVLVSDQVPVVASTVDGAYEYTTYVCGTGSILTADAPVTKPSDVVYDPETKGGINKLITRRRKTYHPNGFTYSMDNMPVSIKYTELSESSHWSRQMQANNIYLVRVVTN